MSSSAAEQRVKKLARLLSNTTCANCGTVKKFGFSTVCIKYFTFVCNNCKSSHQAISHRCKSLTMSSWTDKEVAELERKGNDYARRTWLKNAPPVGQGGRPCEGAPLNVFKRFVVDVYERKRYYGEDEGSNHNAGAAGSRAAVPARVATAVAVPATPRTAKAIRAPVRKSASAPAPPPVVADLLDFTSMPSTTTSQAGAANTGNIAFQANFDAFAPTAAPVPASGSFSNAATIATTPTTTAPIQNDPFQPAQSAVAAVSSTGSSFNFINNNSNNFTAALPPSPAPVAAKPMPAIKKPVMNNHSMSQTSSLISSMNMSGPNNYRQGNHNITDNGNGNGMGWNNNNNYNSNQSSFGGMGNMQPMQQQMMMQQQQMMMMQQQMNMMHGRGGMSNNNAMGAGMMNQNKNNMMMMNQQRAMHMHGNNNFGGMSNNRNGRSNGAMDSLQMNSASMNTWSSGLNK
uniref:Arf-GAP domain-containing protein n=1 Tax=Pseudo-nitzschia australis TaxID=44445 RepID=A0A7S4EGB6_9STRA|mmetsp:Transcript_17318/g.37959  ORF Transcript_17318/g.37959 Transcript_17318/m.37959 type:complete len:458 (-) Transcript_17318:124-1497(-)